MQSDSKLEKREDAGFNRYANKHQHERGYLMYECTQKIIITEEALLNLAEELGNISETCKITGLSHDTFYRYKAAVEEAGVNDTTEGSVVSF